MGSGLGFDAAARPGRAANQRPRSLPDGHLPRARLEDRMGPSTGARVTLVSAAAGYGKTALIRSWVAGLPEGSWTWLTVGPLERDPLAFWTQVIESIHAIAPGLGEAALVDLRTPDVQMEVALLSLLDALEIAVFDHPLVLVVEDLHRASTPAVDASLAWFVDNLPESVHLVLSTRVDPRIPIPLLRLRGDLIEIRQADLAFTPAEAADLWRAIGLADVASPDLAHLLDRAEGWVAGLRMAGAAMRADADASRFAGALDRWQRSIAEFLLDEVLATLDEQAQTFLVDTSVLESLSAPLCEAVTGHAGSTAMLRDLAGRQIFVERLDGEGEWYRNHQLFADLLRDHLHTTRPQREAELHERASDWYAVADRPSEALAHAIAAGSLERQLELLISSSARLHETGHTALAQAVIEGMPPEFVDADAHRAVDYAEALIFAGDGAAAFEVLHRVAATAGPDDAEVWGRIHMLRGLAVSFVGDLDRAERELDAMKALVAVPATELGHRLPLNMGRAYRVADRPEEAIRQFDSIRVERGVSPMLAIAGRGAAALAEIERGDLAAAAVHAQDTEAAWRSLPGPRNVAMCDTLCAAALVRFEAGDVQAARRLLDETLAFTMGHRTGIPWLCTILSRADVELASGDAAGALRRLADAPAGWGPAQAAPPLATRYQEVRALAEAALGHLVAAVDASQCMLPGDRRSLVEARLAIAGGAPAEAVRGIAHVEPTALPRRIQRHLVLAIAHDAAGDSDSAATEVEAALALGLDVGYRMTFARERALVPYYEQRHEAAPSPELAKVLAIAAAVGRPQPLPGTPEVLSQREAEVLALLPTHLTHPEMAATLGVSRNTVKTHLKSIYRKLAATSRSDAVARARDAGVL